MKTTHGWKKSSSGEIIQYDFSAPDIWSSERIKTEMEKLAQVLSAAENSANDSNLPGWYALAKKLPKSLQKVLVSEIGFGNTVIGIGSSNWPNVGSIVVNVANRFNSVSRTISPDVHWRNLDDPHYCREEISQKDLGVEHLIIT